MLKLIAMTQIKDTKTESISVGIKEVKFLK
jgi:hypothetical protein